MLISRLSKHLNEQNWFAVGLDLAMIVLGVFVGLQVDNWNTERGHRAEEADYLARLHHDISESMAGTDFYLEFMNRAADRATLILRDLDRCEIPEADRVDFASGLYQLGKLAPASFSRGTIDELVSTGKLSILRSSAVREELTAMQAVYDNFTGLFSQIEGRITPHVNYIDATVVYRIEEPTRGNAELRWQDIEFDLDAVCRDRRFYTAIAALRNYTYDVVAWNRLTKSAFEAFQTVLAGELGLARPD